MTELQKQNFEHSLRELESTNTAVAKLEAEKKERESSVKFATDRFVEVDRNLGAANLKLLAAKRRFDFAVSEITPDLPTFGFAEGGVVRDTRSRY